MRNNFGNMFMLVVLALGLSACSMTWPEPFMPEPKGEEQPLSASDNDTKDSISPATPALPSLTFSWDISNFAIIAAPLDIRDLAYDACAARGYDSAQMGKIVISGDTATADFICRGAD